MSAGGLTVQSALVLVVVAALNVVHAQLVAISFAGVAVAAAVVLYALRVRALRRRDHELAQQTEMNVPAKMARSIGSAHRSFTGPELPAAGTIGPASRGAAREVALDRTEMAVAPRPSPLVRARPGPLLAAACICAVAFVPAPLHDSFGHEARGTAIDIAAALATAFSAIFVSTLVDWFYVSPLLREDDDEELMLCRSSLHKTWRSVTQVWLFHRLGGVLGFVLGLVAVVTLLASRLIHFNQVAAGAIAALTTVLAGFYLARARDVIAFAVRPAFHVGDKIQLASSDQEDGDRTYFVVDVAIEGVRLLEVTGSEDEVPDQLRAWREHDRILDFSDAAKLIRRRRRLEPCLTTCKRVNAYCPRNKKPTAPPADATLDPERQGTSA